VFKRVAPDRRAAMGDAGKGLVAVLAVGFHRPDGHRLPQRGLRERLVPARLHGAYREFAGSDRLLVLRAFDDPRHDVRARPA
jgi:hypothetical protein